MDIKFRGLSGTYNVRANERDNSPCPNVTCIVQFLDNTQKHFTIDRSSKGQTLLDSVFKHLNLIETDFFGLKFIPHEHCSTNIKSTQNLSPSPILDDNASPLTSSASSSSTESGSIATKAQSQRNRSTSKTVINEESKNTEIESNLLGSNIDLNLDCASSHLVSGRWLNPTKSLKKQCKASPPYKFYFRVKFYVTDPGKLADDTTRNYLYQQLRLDITNRRLVVPTCSAILLASYMLQSEKGDYQHDLLEDSYVSNIRLLPNQSDDFNRKVIELHKQHKSLSAADAEYNFLEHAAKKLDCYGVEFYDAQDSNKANVKIGVSSNGIIVFKDGKRLNQFPWAKILKIMFKKRIFSIQLRREERGSCDNFLEFNLLTNQLCKSFWEGCVAQHSFFRLHQPKSPPKKFFSFLNFGSKFQYNGKTEYQTMEESKKRSFSHFTRSPSKRYARVTIPIGRPSWSSGNSKKNRIDNNINDDDDDDNNNDNNEDNQAPIEPEPSSSSNRSNIEESIPSSYRPKSLTLKSFMYIDEAHQSNDHQRVQRANLNCSSHHDEADMASKIPNNINKKDLKRCESLRIANSIKGAIQFTKKAGVTSSHQLARLSGSLRDKFLTSKSPKSSKDRSTVESVSEEQECSDDLETMSETSLRVVRLTPGKDGRFGFKIRKISSKKGKHVTRRLMIYGVSPNSPASNSDPRLYEGDEILKINGIAVESMSISVEKMIKSIQYMRPPELVLEISSQEDCIRNFDSTSSSSGRRSAASASKLSETGNTLADSIRQIKEGLRTKELIDNFEKLSRKKEDETLEESRLMENVDKNRYQDILPYDSTRVQLIDSMTGDYINASFVNMPVPSGNVNRYIATQGPLESTCDDFWQMVWEQNCSLIIMVTPLVEGGRIKCHKYWPDEKEEVRHGQILVKNINEKLKAATIDRNLQLIDVKSGKKRMTTQIQYKAWPDHEVPADCCDFLKLVNRVRSHRSENPNDPIVVHCSAGIGRTGVLILMETAICIMESGEPIYPIRILEDMRKQRAMLIQTGSQFQFVTDAICKVYDQKSNKKSKKNKRR